MSNPIKKIMVYVDGTEQSVTAAQYAICLASFSGAELIAHYVINTRAVEDLLKARIFLEDEQVEYEHDMEVDSIEADDVDLLVIGELSRIRSRRDEFFDETERAMRAVPCSVLIVKDEDRVWEMYESLV